MYCEKCGFNNSESVRFCIECGGPLKKEYSSEFSVETQITGQETPVTADIIGNADSYAMDADYRGMEGYQKSYTSDSYAMDADYRGMVSQKPAYTSSPYSGFLPSGNDPKMLPMARGGWNWGAFTFSWIWLLAHNMVTWGILLLFLNFISGLGIVASIYLGIKGNELAWTYRPFRNFQHFEETERVWNYWGIIFFILPLIMIAGFFIFMLLNEI